jgi:hypothetical protein
MMVDRWSADRGAILNGLGRFLGDGEDLRDLAAHLFKASRVFEGSGGTLQEQVHGFLFEVAEALGALVGGKFADVFGFGGGLGRIVV